jgi:hypothetical protein
MVRLLWLTTMIESSHVRRTVSTISSLGKTRILTTALGYCDAYIVCQVCLCVAAVVYGVVSVWCHCVVCDVPLCGATLPHALSAAVMPILIANPLSLTLVYPDANENRSHYTIFLSVQAVDNSVDNLWITCIQGNHRGVVFIQQLVSAY